MNYAFKMMAVVLVLGVLVLQGCQTANFSNYSNSFNNRAVGKSGTNALRNYFANNRNYSSQGLKNKQNNLNNNYNSSNLNSNNKLSSKAGTGVGAASTGESATLALRNYFNTNKNIYKTNNSTKQIDTKIKQINRYSDYVICLRSKWIKDNYQYLEEAKRRGLDCNEKDKRTYVASSNTNANVSLAELDKERKKRIELERKLVELENKQKKEKQIIDKDILVPLLEIISSITKGKRGTLTGIARDNVGVAEVTVNGKRISLSSDGMFNYNTYVPPTGKKLIIQVIDIAGLTTSKLVELKANRVSINNSIHFDALNPLGKKVKTNPNALALIIGVSNYENTQAKALFADNDALLFRDYASEKLGIPETNIKELVNDAAERIDITKAIKTWLLKRTVTSETDIYIFFAGHGLATDDGKGMYLLPYDGVPDLLEDSAIQRKQLFADIQATKPRSVTVFLDTCYSGGTRNEETLVASLRPIIITAKEQAIPSNFTVLSAAQGNQTSQSLEEVKHGLFSYYTMLGMEGGADANNDNKITARELHTFIKDKVERQSQFRQTPELQGDKDRVLVQFN